MALVAILLWYLGLGILAAIGAITLTRKRFSPREERFFFALILVPIAAIYLAFVGYFQGPGTLRHEAWAVLAFTGMALLGIRFPLFIVAGYALHGAWDIVHEMRSVETLTPIPLAYGVFCLTFDVIVAVYIYKRRLAG